MQDAFDGHGPIRLGFRSHRGARVEDGAGDSELARCSAGERLVEQHSPVGSTIVAPSVNAGSRRSARDAYGSADSPSAGPHASTV